MQWNYTEIAINYSCAQRYEFINAGKMQKNWIDAVSQDLKEMKKSSEEAREHCLDRSWCVLQFVFDTGWTKNQRICKYGNNQHASFSYAKALNVFL